MKLLKRTDLPMIPLRDLVVFPRMVVPFFVGRKRSVKALEEANHRGKIVFLTTQKSDQSEDPAEEDLYRTGTVAKILQMLKLPDGTLRVLVEGTERAGLVRITDDKSLLKALIKPIKESSDVDAKITALMRTVKTEFSRYIKLVEKVPQETVADVAKIDTPDRLVNAISASTPLKVEQKMKLLSFHTE